MLSLSATFQIVSDLVYGIYVLVVLLAVTFGVGYGVGFAHAEARRMQGER